MCDFSFKENFKQASTLKELGQEDQLEGCLMAFSFSEQHPCSEVTVNACIIYTCMYNLYTVCI